METTVMTIQSGNNTYYFDQNPDGTVKLCRDEKYIATYINLGQAFMAFYIRRDAKCIDLKVKRIDPKE
jgi:hypothetical protein